MFGLGLTPRRLLQRIFQGSRTAEDAWKLRPATVTEAADQPAENTTAETAGPDPDHASAAASETPAAAQETVLATARTFAEQGHFDVAERTLELARQRFPESPLPLIDYAKIAEAKRDWAAMAARYAVLRIRFPGDILGYHGGTHALRELGRLDEADVLFEAAQDRFPNEPSLFIEYGQIAELRRDWSAMDERFAEVRLRFPDSESGYTGGAKALSRQAKFAEAEALLEIGQKRFPNEPTVFIDHARVAEQRRDWAALEARCAALREQFPDEPWPYAGGALALRGLGRYNEVDVLLTDADLRFPVNPTFWVEYARAADDRGDWEEARSRCVVIREQFPDEWWGYIGGANAEDMLGRREEARLLVEAGLARTPAEIDPLGVYCWLAQNRKDWPEAVSRWVGYRRRFPDRAVGYFTESVALRELSRFDEADAVALEGLRRHPRDGELLSTYASIASARQDWEEALVRWQDYLDRFPQHTAGYVHAGIAQRELERFDDADFVLREALTRFPEDSAIIENYAWNAHEKHDWLEALRRWKIYCVRFPGSPLGHEQTRVVLQELGYFDASRNAEQVAYQGIIDQLRSELYGGNSPLTYADPNYVDHGYPPTNLQTDLIESILDTVRPRFWLELGSTLGASAIRTAEVIKANSAPTEIVCIDPFTGDVNMWSSEQSKKQAGDWHFLRLEQGMTTMYKRFLANIAAAGHDDIILPIAATSIVGVRLLRRLAEEQRLVLLPNVIYLDGAQEADETLLELRTCWDLLKPGGVLMGDDWDSEAVRNDVLRFADTIRINAIAVHRLSERHQRFTEEEGILLDRGQWVLMK